MRWEVEWGPRPHSTRTRPVPDPGINMLLTDLWPTVGVAVRICGCSTPVYRQLIGINDLENLSFPILWRQIVHLLTQLMRLMKYTFKYIYK